MDIVIRKPSLATNVAGLLVLMLFAGRWGIGVESHTSLSVLGSVLYEFAFQLRWWLLVVVALLVAFDYKQRGRSLVLRARHRGVMVFLLLSFILLSGAAFTEGTDYTIKKAFDVAGLAVTVMLLFYVQNHRPGSDEQLQKSILVFCFLVGSAISLLALFTADLTQRAAVADGGPNTFVRIVGVAAISCIGIQRIPRVFAFVATAVYLTLIVLTQSRGGLLAFTCAVGLQFIWIFGWRSRLVYGMIGLATIGAVANFTAIGQRCVEIIEIRVFSQTLTYNYTAGRDQIYAESWYIWEDAFIFGHGLSDWWDRLGTYPHNIFLEIGCDSGLVGMAAFVLLLCIYLVSAAKCRTPVAKSIACLTLFYFLAAQFSGDLYDSRGLFYFGTMLCASQLAVSPNVPKTAALPSVAKRRGRSPATTSSADAQGSLV